MASDITWLRTEVTQERLARMAEALCMTPKPKGKLWLSGSARSGWWLSGLVEGDCALPMTRGARTSREAFEHAWGWLAPEIEKGEGPDGQ